MLHLKKIKQRKTAGNILILNLHTKNLDDMICSSKDIELDRLKVVILGHFMHFYPVKNPKKTEIIILEMLKKSQ